MVASLWKRAGAWSSCRIVNPCADQSACLRNIWLAGIAWLAALSSAMVSAADVRPSWHCLPEETVVLARIPEPKEFYDAFRTRTKLGAVLLKQDRINKAMELFRENAKEAFDKFEKRLSERNLKIDDWQGFFADELGVALVVQPRADEKLSPLMMVLAWAEPGEDLSGRLIAALEQSIDDQAGKKFPTKRIDLELAGHKVLYLIEPQTDSDIDIFDDLPADYGKFTPEQRLEWQQKQRKKAEEAQTRQTGQQNVFLTHIGGRMLVGMTLPTGPSFVEFQADGNKAVNDDFDAVSGAEEAKGVFARFLGAHETDAPSSTLKLLDTPGLRQTLPDGITAFEVLGDLRPLWKLANKDNEEQVRMMKSFGLEGVGPMAYRHTLDGNLARAGIFVSLPAPRQGVFALMEQNPGQSEIPAWVARDVVQYEHVIFDLGKFYTDLKQLLVTQLGDQVKPTYDTVEQQAQAFLQTDPASLLSSLGTRHSVLNYMPKFDLAGGKLDEKTAEEFDANASRMALVWELKDEALWKRLMQMAAPFAGGKLLDEQGFTGLRAPQGNIGVFVGRGFLVVGTGTGSVETTLTALRNPPKNDGSLRDSAVSRRAAELIGAEPSAMYQILDGERYGKLIGQLSSLFAHLPVDDANAAQRDLLGKLQKLLPEDKDLEGILGVGAGLLQWTDQGIVIRSVNEMPAP